MRAGCLLLGLVFGGVFIVLVYVYFLSNTPLLHRPLAEVPGSAPSPNLTRGHTSCGQYIATSISSEEAVAMETCMATFRTQKFIISGSYGSMELDRTKGHTFLNKNSTVLEVGGFRGIDSKVLYDMFGCNFIILEPVPAFFAELQEKYVGNPSFKLLKYGLGTKDQTLHLVLDEDGTSAFKTSKENETAMVEAVIRSTEKFFRDLRVGKPDGQRVDLLVVNCEGCEYGVFESLIESGIIQHLPNVQMQFHVDLPGVPSLDCRYCQLQTLMARTHAPTFHYSFVWQAWHRK